MPSNPSSYQAYLLRLWRTTPDTTWRASLESVGSRTTHYFVSPEDLLAHLYNQLNLQANIHEPNGENNAKNS